VLAGEQTLGDIVLNDWSWYQDHHILLHAGYTVTAVDRARRTVHAVNALGESASAEYDRLIMATGSKPFILPMPGKDLEGVLAYRDIADTEAMIEAAKTLKHAVVIGGLLGLEAANGLMKRGMQVTVVHVGDWLMERQLDDQAGRMLQKSLAERGMQFRMQAQTQALLGDDARGRVRAVRFKDGSEIPAELVVMAVGIRPSTALAESMACM
jgi:nitrite reductase (NADH) large subunit